MRESHLVPYSSCAMSQMPRLPINPPYDQENSVNISGLDTGLSTPSLASMGAFAFDGHSKPTTRTPFMPPYPASMFAFSRNPVSLAHQAGDLLPMDYLLARSARGTNSDEPWNPAAVNCSPFDASRHQFSCYRSGDAPSEHDMPTLLSSDSGYGTRPSVGEASIHGDPDVNFDTQSIVSHIRHVNLLESQGLRSQTSDETVHLPSDPKGQCRGPYTCDICSQELGAKSELRKHNQKYHKKHYCDVPGCKREDRPFGTINDLDRHKKSVHYDTSIRGIWYECNEGPCAGKGKQWPRTDNFRSHLRRVHRFEIPPNFDLKPYHGSSQAAMTEPPESADMPPLLHDPLSPVQQNVAPPIQDTLAGLCGSTMSPELVLDDRNTGGAYAIEYPYDINSSMSPLQAESMFGLHMENIVQDSLLHSPDLLSSIFPDLPPFSNTLQRKTNSAVNKAAMSISQSPQFQEAIEESSEQQHENGTAVPDTNDDDSDQETHTSTEAITTPPTGSGVEDSFLAGEEEYLIRDTDTTTVPENVDGFDLMIFDFLDTVPRDLLVEYLNKDGKLSVKGTQSASPSHQQCPQCPKSFNRKCELKKHVKRHEKPYGCTFPRCRKKFGSKNDWKRHESSQHFQFEVWQCDEPDCTQQCNRRETFRSHLASIHHITDNKKLDIKLDYCRSGRSCDGQFWCGFCVQDIAIDGEGVAAWKDRFNHIDDHFSGRSTRKMEIGEWKKPGGIEDDDQDQDDSNDDDDIFAGTGDNSGDGQTAASPPASKVTRKGSKRPIGDCEENGEAKRVRVDGSLSWSSSSMSD